VRYGVNGGKSWLMLAADSLLRRVHTKVFISETSKMALRRAVFIDSARGILRYGLLIALIYCGRAKIQCLGIELLIST
jgi:hypothetical protein